LPAVRKLSTRFRRRASGAHGADRARGPPGAGHPHPCRQPSTSPARAEPPPGGGESSFSNGRMRPERGEPRRWARSSGRRTSRFEARRSELQARALLDSLGGAF